MSKGPHVCAPGLKLVVGTPRTWPGLESQEVTTDKGTGSEDLGGRVVRTGVQWGHEQSHEWGHDLLSESAGKVQNPKNAMCLMVRAQSVQSCGGHRVWCGLSGDGICHGEVCEDMCA